MDTSLEGITVSTVTDEVLEQGRAGFRSQEPTEGSWRLKDLGSAPVSILHQLCDLFIRRYASLELLKCVKSRLECQD